MAECRNLDNHHVWTPVKSKGGERVLPLIIGYKRKLDKNGNVEKCKVRVCADGRRQVKGIDCKETHAPVIGVAVMRLVMAISVELQMERRQFDFTGAFLNARHKKANNTCDHLPSTRCHRDATH